NGLEGVASHLAGDRTTSSGSFATLVATAATHALILPPRILCNDEMRALWRAAAAGQSEKAKPGGAGKENEEDEEDGNHQYGGTTPPPGFPGKGIRSRPTLDDHCVCPRSRPWFVMLAWWVSADLIKKTGWARHKHVPQHILSLHHMGHAT